MRFGFRLRRVVCVIGIVLSLSTFLAGYGFRTAVDATVEAQGVQNACRDLLISLLDAETGQRGYLITGNRAYLEPYKLGVDTVGARQQVLATLLKGTPEQSYINVLAGLITRKLAELAKVVTQRDAGETKLAVSQVDTGVGKSVMDQIRADLATIELWAQTSGDLAVARARMMARISFFTLIGAVIAGSYIVFVRP